MSLSIYRNPAASVMFAMVGLMTSSVVLGEQLRKGLSSVDEVTREVARRCLSLSSLLEVNKNMDGVYSDCRDRAIVQCDVSHSLQSCDALRDGSDCEAAYSNCLDTYCLEEKTAFEKVYDALVSAKALCESAIEQDKPLP